MRIVKSENARIVGQYYDTDYYMTLEIGKAHMDMLKDKLSKVETLKITDNED